MEIRRHNENDIANLIESKFKWKNAHEIYDWLLSWKITAEEFMIRYYRESSQENPGYTKRIKIKEAVDWIKKWDKMAILEVRRLILRMESTNK